MNDPHEVDDGTLVPDGGLALELQRVAARGQRGRVGEVGRPGHLGRRPTQQFRAVDPDFHVPGAEVAAPADRGEENAVRTGLGEVDALREVPQPLHEAALIAFRCGGDEPGRARGDSGPGERPTGPGRVVAPTDGRRLEARVGHRRVGVAQLERALGDGGGPAVGVVRGQRQGVGPAAPATALGEAAGAGDLAGQLEVVGNVAADVAGGVERDLTADGVLGESAAAAVGVDGVLAVVAAQPVELEVVGDGGRAGGAVEPEEDVGPVGNRDGARAHRARASGPETALRNGRAAGVAVRPG